MTAGVRGTEALITVRAIDKATKNQDKIRKSMDKLTNSQVKQGKQLKKNNIQAKKAASANAKLKTTLRNLSSSIAVVDGPLGGIASRFNAFGTVVGRVDIRLLKLAAAFIAISAAARIGLQAFSEFESLSFKLQATLDNTGRGAAASFDKLTKAAQELAIATLASEEGALEAVTAIASFEDIPDEKIIDILKLSQDLSVILGGDLKQNAILLGRAFNDVEGAAEFLRRKGLKLNAQQREYITTLIEQGNQLEAITFLQSKLSNIQGVAEAEAKGLAGVYDTLGVTLKIVARNFVEYTGIVALAKGVGLALTAALRGLDTILLIIRDTIGFVEDNFASLSVIMGIITITQIPRMIAAVTTLSAVLATVFTTLAFPGILALTSQLSKLALVMSVLVKIGASVLKFMTGILILSSRLIPALRGVALVMGTIAILNPFAASVVGVLSLIAGVVLLISKFEEIKEVLQDVLTGANIIFAVLTLASKKAALRVQEAWVEAAVRIKFAILDIPFIGDKLGLDADKIADTYARATGEIARARQEAQKFAELQVARALGLDIEPADSDRGKERGQVDGISDANKKILDSLRKQLESAKDQQAVNELLLSGAETSESVARLIVKREKARTEAAKNLLTQTIAITRQLEAQREALEAQGQGRDRVKAILEEQIALKDKLTVTNLLISGEERSAAVAALTVQIQKEADPITRRALELTRELTVELEAQNKILKQQEKDWASVNSAINNTFSSIIRGSDTVSAALAKLSDKLAEIAIESAFASINIGNLFRGSSGGGPFDFLGSIFSAKGNVFNNGSHVEKFKHGGIFDSPTFFPIRGNTTGVLGESGPEAILPLTRTTGGDLGVKAELGVSGDTNISMPVQVEVNIRSEGRENLSDPEQARKMGNLISNAVQTTVLEVIDRETRAGGRLSANSRNRGTI